MGPVMPTAGRCGHKEGFAEKLPFRPPLRTRHVSCEERQEGE